HRRIGLAALDKIRHHVLSRPGGLLKLLECPEYLAVIPFPAKLFQTLHLFFGGLPCIFVELNVHRFAFRIDVEAYLLQFTGLPSFLILIGLLWHETLDVPGTYGVYNASALLDLCHLLFYL